MHKKDFAIRYLHLFYSINLLTFAKSLFYTVNFMDSQKSLWYNVNIFLKR